MPNLLYKAHKTNQVTGLSRCCSLISCRIEKVKIVKRLFLSLGGLVAALRRGDEEVEKCLSSALYCFDRLARELFVISSEPDGSSTTRVVLDEFLSGPRQCDPAKLHRLAQELYEAFESGPLYVPPQDRLDYQQLDGFLAQQGLHPTGLAGNLGYNYPDAIVAILRANPRDLLVYDHAGRPWSSITADWPHSDDPLDGDPESLATA